MVFVAKIRKSFTNNNKNDRLFMMASLCMDVCLLSIEVTATLNIFGMIGCQSLRMRQLDHNKYVDEIAKS